MSADLSPIYHLVPAAEFESQPDDQPYCPAAFEADGFIHCTAGLDLLVQIANTYFHNFNGVLLVVEIDPARLTASLKFEPPIHPSDNEPSAILLPEDTLFPHIYGPLNRDAITGVFSLVWAADGRWQLP